MYSKVRSAQTSSIDSIWELMTIQLSGFTPDDSYAHESLRNTGINVYTGNIEEEEIASGKMTMKDSNGCVYWGRPWKWLAKVCVKA